MSKARKIDRVALQFYDNSLFPQSKTYKKWVPLACDDLHQLIPYREVYKYTADTKYHDAYKVWFFANHPITHVSIRGRCLSVDIKIYEKTSEWMTPKCIVTMMVTDYTGETAIVESVSYNRNNKRYYSDLKGQFIRANGKLKLLRSGSIAVEVVDICAAATSLREELLMMAEVHEVRERVLMQPWVPKLNFKMLAGPTEEDNSAGTDLHADGFLSFYRRESMLYRENTSLLMKRTVLSDPKMHQPNDLSIIEDRANTQYVLRVGVAFHKSNMNPYFGTDHETRSIQLTNLVETTRAAEEEAETMKTEETTKAKYQAESELSKAYHDFLLHMFTKETNFRLTIDHHLTEFTSSIGLISPDILLDDLVDKNVVSRIGKPPNVIYEWRGMDSVYQTVDSIINTFLLKRYTKYLAFSDVKDKVRKTNKETSDKDILFAIRNILNQQKAYGRKWYETSIRGKFPNNLRWNPSPSGGATSATKLREVYKPS